MRRAPVIAQLDGNPVYTLTTTLNLRQSFPKIRAIARPMRSLIL
jgi:hypothetical protein